MNIIMDNFNDNNSMIDDMDNSIYNLMDKESEN
jgi:hypothetical protein